MAFPVQAIQGLTWQNYTNNATDLIAPLDLDFTTYSEYDVRPSGIFGATGNRTATGLVVDNLLSGVPVIVEIGPLRETIPPYTKQLIQLTSGSPLVKITAVAVKIRVSFFAGAFAGSTAGSNFYQAQIQAGLAVETGMVYMFAGSTAAIPTGYLLCDGAAIPRAQYPGLFSVIGTLYGAGDGSTTFNLPDTPSRAIVGAGSSGGRTPRALAATGGAERVTLTAAESAKLTVSISDPGHGHGVSDPGHTHAISQSVHGHLVTDTGHNHGLNNPAHNHGISQSVHGHNFVDPGHAHGIGDGGHSHGLNNPGHTHGVSDPGHSHHYVFNRLDNGAQAATPNNILWNSGGSPDTYGNSAPGEWTNAGRPNFWNGSEAYRMYIGAVTAGISVGSAGAGVTMTAATTGVTINGALTGCSVTNEIANLSNVAAGAGVTITAATTGLGIVPQNANVSNNSAATGVTVSGALTGITATTNGGNGSHENMPPFLALNFIIKT